MVSMYYGLYIFISKISRRKNKVLTEQLYFLIMQCVLGKEYKIMWQHKGRLELERCLQNMWVGIKGGGGYERCCV